MSSEIRYEEHDDFLRIKYAGYENIDEFFYSIEKALKICQEKNYSKVILDVIDVDFTFVSGMNKYHAGEKIAKLSRHHEPIKVAVVGPKKYYDGFVDNVATNRGALIKMFTETNNALHWLREK